MACSCGAKLGTSCDNSCGLMVKLQGSMCGCSGLNSHLRPPWNVIETYLTCASNPPLPTVSGEFLGANSAIFSFIRWGDWQLGALLVGSIWKRLWHQELFPHCAPMITFSTLEAHVRYHFCEDVNSYQNDSTTCQFSGLLVQMSWTLCTKARTVRSFSSSVSCQGFEDSLYAKRYRRQNRPSLHVSNERFKDIILRLSTSLQATHRAGSRKRQWQYRYKIPQPWLWSSIRHQNQDWYKTISEYKPRTWKPVANIQNQKTTKSSTFGSVRDDYITCWIVFPSTTQNYYALTPWPSKKKLRLHWKFPFSSFRAQDGP